MHTVTIRIPKHHNFHAEIAPLAGPDLGLFEARCKEAPTLSDYAASEEEALALLKGSIQTTLKYRTI